MKDPNHPQQFSEIPGVPPPPPKLNARRLWMTLLAPSVLMVLIMVIMLIARNFGGNTFGGDDLFIMACCSVPCLAAPVAWGFFIHTIYQRFRGPSLVLLILAYPILQTVLLVAIFFTGCFAMISIHGY